MKNISFDGKEIVVKENNTYYLMDTLYFNRISNYIKEIDQLSFENDIKEKIFPYTIAPFCKIEWDKDIFDISRIKKANDEDKDTLNRKRCFSSETGLVMLVEKSLFLSIATKFDYDKLLDNPIDLINEEYWNKLIEGLKTEDIGLILAPGFDSGYEFEGGGFYEIK